MRTPRERSQLAQRAGDDRQHDVVDGAAERVLDRLEVLELACAPTAKRRCGPICTLSGVCGRRVRGRPRRSRRRPRRPRGALPTRAPRGASARRPRARRARTACATSPRSPVGGELAPAEGSGARRPLPRRRARPAAGPASRSNSTVARSTPEMPSTSAWWVLEISAKRLSSRPCDEPHLPQRLGAVELLGEDPRGEVAQLLLDARARAARCGARGTRG